MQRLERVALRCPLRHHSFCVFPLLLVHLFIYSRRSIIKHIKNNNNNIKRLMGHVLVVGVMALQVWLALSNHTLPITKPSFSAQNNNHYHPDKERVGRVSVCLSKRELLHVSSIGGLLFLNGLCPKVSKANEKSGLERYTDSKEGFTVLRPSSWIKVEKAGATLLFEEPNKGSNNVGVVVNPVRLTTLSQFGTPQFVAEKLIQAEKRKESTIDAELIGVAERSGQGGLQVYEFEYKVDSSRGGIKRIFSAAFVSSKKLYLLNINHSDKPESPLDNHTRMMLERVLHSFDSAPST